MMAREDGLTDSLFGPVVAPPAPRPPGMSAQALHRAGREILAHTIEPGGTFTTVDRVHEYHTPDGRRMVLRVRDARALGDDPMRLTEVTVRRKTACGQDAEEWLRMAAGTIDLFAYGWVTLGDGASEGLPSLTGYVLLRAGALARAVIHHPGCLVPPPGGRRTVLHHAPGGAEFYVIDVKRLPGDAVVKATVPAATDTAPYYEPPVQRELW